MRASGNRCRRAESTGSAWTTYTRALGLIRASRRGDSRSSGSMAESFRKIHHRDTEDTEQRENRGEEFLSLFSALCLLCALCVSVVNPAFAFPDPRQQSGDDQQRADRGQVREYPRRGGLEQD